MPNGISWSYYKRSYSFACTTLRSTGYVIEYAGSTIRNLTMEDRMTICNMSIEAGARAGMIAPDEKTFEYVKGRDCSPTDEQWEKAIAYWKDLPSDQGATFYKVLIGAARKFISGSKTFMRP